MTDSATSSSSGPADRDENLAAKDRDYPRWIKRLLLARALHEWPWRIPAEVVRGIGMRRPPEHVFEAFRRLHGLD